MLGFEDLYAAGPYMRRAGGGGGVVHEFPKIIWKIQCEYLFCFFQRNGL